MNKDPLVFISHIIDSIKDIEHFMKNVSKELFFKNKEKRSAVIRQIEVIGEAVKNLPSDFKDRNPNIPWKDIVGMRDKLMHHYFGVDLETIWKTVNRDIPVLKKQVQDIMKELLAEKC